MNRSRGTGATELLASWEGVRLDVGFVAREALWTATAPSEHVALAWLTPDELAALPLAHASYRALLAGALSS